MSWRDPGKPQRRIITRKVHNETGPTTVVNSDTGYNDESSLTTNRRLSSLPLSSVHMIHNMNGVETPKDIPKDDDSDSGWDTDLEIDNLIEVSKVSFDASGKKVYQQTCADLGVIPVSHFMRHMRSPKVVMKHHGLGPIGAKAIAIPLVTNTSVLTLDLEDNWIESDGAIYIADMMKENCYIADLNMSENKIGSKGAPAMCEMMHDNQSLRKVNLSGNGFGDRDAEHFAYALQSNYSRIQELNLSYNQFSETGGEILGPAIATNDTVEILNLSWNHIRRKGAISICRGLAENIGIKVLDLSWNGLANEGALAMAEALKFNSNLIELDLRNNRITNEGAVLLSKGLEINDTLQILKLGLNPITAAGAHSLLLAMRVNTNTAIIEIDFTDIMVNKDFLELLQEIQEIRPEFRVIYKGAFGAFKKPEKEKPDPLKMLRDYIEKNNLRVWDLFKAYDKDKSMSVSNEEFKKGINASGLPMSDSQIDELMSTLDKDGDGEIDYSELVLGHRVSKQTARDKRKEKMIKVFDRRSDATFIPVAQQFVDLDVDDATKNMSEERRNKLNKTLRPDVQQWDAQGRKGQAVGAALRSLDATVDLNKDLRKNYTKEETFLSKTMDFANFEALNPKDKKFTKGRRPRTPRDSLLTPRKGSPAKLDPQPHELLQTL
ncbi:leucine-rich repeat-containing protein 74A-like isoform X2 [Anneissia japonica]|uniref:leucine-rich repeat-containing protein 74A-like isoform X2 n=1 Tax=Anneissia japonica TaxID=1529436 RepID=UPI0014256AE7|nr:leucine-rich repeat-containing protein 74A-like isoform X2 [Anneissia japonica]